MSPVQSLSDVDVVVVTFNSGQIVGRCLDALTGCSASITVIDNCSTDDTVEIVQQFPVATLIRNPNNEGFAKAVNVGVDHGSSKTIIALNPDAILNIPSAEALVEYLDHHPEVAVVGPNVSAPEDNLRTASAGRRPDCWRIFCHFSGLSSFANLLPFTEGLAKRQKSFRGYGDDVDWVTGACLVTRRSVWEKLGGLSNRWFMYAEDIEYCLRASKYGFVRFLPSIHVYHSQGRSDRGSTMRRSPAWILNLLDLYALRIAPSTLHVVAWAIIAASGLSARGAIFRILSFRGTNRLDYATRAPIFFSYAKATVYAIPAAVRTRKHRSSADSWP